MKSKANNIVKQFFSGALLASLLFTGAVCASGAGKNLNAPGAQAVKKAVQDYTRAVSKLDYALLEKTLHGEFRTHATFGDSGKFMLLNKEQYIGAMKAGKVGGKPMNVKFQELELDGNIASVRADLTSSVLRLESHYSLVKTAEGWRVTQTLVRAVKLPVTK